ncbi:hypothetical protein [Rhodococcus sp. W8901]|uniref:hypothetical protein n=1 Tax=Rhodococcus sp. W8901 TaxID=2742603 RepID=UPI0020C6DC20|nr:hypothetical protein [Rhodococcus sp. W8901]
MQSPRKQGLTTLVVVAAVVVLTAVTIGAWKYQSKDTSTATNKQINHPAAQINHPAASAEPRRACAPGASEGDGPAAAGTAQRLTDVMQRAGELLRVRGAAWGRQVATGTQLSASEAFELAASVPGDATAVEMEWLRQAQRDGVYDDPNRSLETIVRHIESTTITDGDLLDHLGQNWPAIVNTVGDVAAIGFDDYVDQVRASPPMRSAAALDLRSQLRVKAVASGLKEQWDRSQELVGVYFQECSSDAAMRRDPSVPVADYIQDWDLAEALVRDAVAAAFFAGSSGDDLERINVLERGLQIVQTPDDVERDDSLTRSVQPNENLHPDDAALLELEEPSLDDE